MPELQRPLEEIRLEIVILAAGVLILVSLLGILILMSIGLKMIPPTRKPDAERYENTTAWGGVYTEPPENTQPIEPYHDETFMDTVRRRSLSWAEDFKREFSLFTRKVSVPIPTGTSYHRDSGVADSLRTFSLDQPSSAHRSHVLNNGSTWCRLMDSPVSATGRDAPPDEARRRSTRVADDMTECDLERQTDDSDDSS